VRFNLGCSSPSVSDALAVESAVDAALFVRCSLGAKQCAVLAALCAVWGVDAVAVAVAVVLDRFLLLLVLSVDVPIVFLSSFAPLDSSAESSSLAWGVGSLSLSMIGVHCSSMSRGSIG
jgi:hypothetical protein